MTSSASPRAVGRRVDLPLAVLLGAVLAIGGCAVASPPTSAPAIASPSTSIPATSVGTQPLPAEVSVEEAAQLRDAGAFMLDVREPDEWAAGHIPEATLVPLGQLKSRLDEVPKDAKVVVVCRSGNRSATGRDILLDAGHPVVTSMAGGMNEWMAAGLPIETGE